MDKEQIEKAADAYTQEIIDSNTFDVNYEESNYDAGSLHATSEVCPMAFKAGAEWRINSVWHDSKNEIPELNRHVVNEDWFDFEAKDEKDLKRILKTYPFKRWAYVEDLLYTEKEVRNNGR